MGATKAKNAIIVNPRICFQQAIYALNLIDISFWLRGSALGIDSENEAQFKESARGIFWSEERYFHFE